VAHDDLNEDQKRAVTSHLKASMEVTLRSSFCSGKGHFSCTVPAGAEGGSTRSPCRGGWWSGIPEHLCLLLLAPDY
jgi:hypothetical protein